MTEAGQGIQETDPFRDYFESLNKTVQKSYLNVTNPRSLFGYTGTLNQDAMKVKPTRNAINSQGIVVRQSRHAVTTATEKVKQTLLQQQEETMKKLRPTVEALKQTTKTCMFCHKKYQLSQNYGFWNCRYHPVIGTDVNSYECCGQKKTYDSIQGCTPCDHQSLAMHRYFPWNAATATVEIPLIAAVELKIPPESYKLIESKEEICRTKVIIRRTQDKFPE